MLALAELDFGSGDNPERGKAMTFTEDQSVAMKPSGMEIQLTPPVIPF